MQNLRVFIMKGCWILLVEFSTFIDMAGDFYASFCSCAVFTLIQFQFSSVAQSHLTLCDPMNHSTPGLPFHQQLPKFTQTHVHWVGDAIQPSHPLSPPSPPALNLSQHQGLFRWVSSLHQVAIVLEFHSWWINFDNLIIFCFGVELFRTSIFGHFWVSWIWMSIFSSLVLGDF